VGALLIQGRYKVVRTLWRQRDFAAVEAADIRERGTPPRLLNLYEGPLLRRYGRIYSRLAPGSCPAFRGVFLERGTLAAVFETAAGTPVDEVFFMGDGWDWRERLRCARELLRRALLLSDLPPAVACAALLSDNLLFDRKTGRLALRFLIRPMAEMDARELVFLTRDQLQKILPPRLARPDAEQRFFDALAGGEFPSLVPVCALWREAEPEIRAGYEEWDRKHALERAAWLARRALAKRGRGRRL